MPVLKTKLFEAYCLNGAGIHAYPAIYAKLGVDFCLAINHLNCLAGTFTDAAFTAGAFVLINNCCHNYPFIKKNSTSATGG